PAHPARTSAHPSATTVPKTPDRELCVLSIHTIIRVEPSGVERAKNHDRWRKLNCTLVMQMAVIEVAAGILKLPRRIWQLAPSGILQIVVGKGFDRFVYEPTKPAYR